MHRVVLMLAVPILLSAFAGLSAQTDAEKTDAERPHAAAAAPRIADLAWMAGAWRNDSRDGFTDEVWSAPADRSMVGCSRIGLASDRAVYEILLIEESADGPVLWLRHFKPGLIAREEQPMKFKTVRAGKNEIAFERVDESGGTRLSYRLAEPDRLVAILEKTQNGKKRQFEFSLKRVPQ